MAVQFAVAHSARVTGVGVFAGGPYYCVGINPARAESVCMQGNPGADASILDAERLAMLQLIDSTQNLRSMRAWLLAGEADTKVVPPVVRASYEFFVHYNRAGAQFRVLPGLGHGLPTPTKGVPCSASESPFLNRCGVDEVGEMLAALDAGNGRGTAPGAAPAVRPAGVRARPGGAGGRCLRSGRPDTSSFRPMRTGQGLPDARRSARLPAGRQSHRRRVRARRRVQRLGRGA